MKDDNQIMTDSLMARIRELELQIANRDFAITMMCDFLRLKDKNHPLTNYGNNLQENYISYTVEEYDNDGIYDGEVRLNPDDVEHAMLSYFKDYETEDMNTLSALDSYLVRSRLRK